MSKLVFRIQKLAHNGNIAASVMHATRELPTPNAVGDSTKNKLVGAKTKDEFMTSLNQRLTGVKIPRSDSPKVIEYLISASPDYFDDQDKDGAKLFQRSLDWLKKTHGAENVLLATIHHDEATPHLSAFVVPFVPGTKTLSAKHFVGGKKALSQLQTSCWEASGRPLGIERGAIGSEARHMKTNVWKAAIQSSIKPNLIEDLPPPTLNDRLNPEKWAEPAINSLRQANIKLRQAALKVTTADQLILRNKNEEMRLEKKQKSLDLVANDLIIKSNNIAMKIELESNKMIAAVKASYDERLEKMDKDNTELIKTTAMLIKQNYHIKDLAITMGVELRGKADIFDLMVKSGKAKNFKDAVNQVSEQLNLVYEVDHGKTDIKERAEWSLAYAQEMAKESELDDPSI